jgi:hypothetical protein
MKHTLPLLAALLLAPLAAVHATDPLANSDRFPSFSWERVPRYMHIRKDTAFTTDEIRYLASFPLVTFEKGTGATQSGSTEAGTLAAARAVKAINPATKVLYYRNVIVHYGGYAANASLTNMPGAFLVGHSGSDTLVRSRVQAYDLTNAKMRDWWLASAKRVCADPAIDGLFFDGNIKVLEPAYLRDEIGEKKNHTTDGIPDLDHFGSGSIALQRMLAQEGNGKIYLLPAWPAEWDADFKLHLEGDTVLTGTVKDGKLLNWECAPAARSADVVVCGPAPG